MEYLPKNSPAFWHTTDGQPYTLTENLLWNINWLLLHTIIQQRQIAGDKKAKMPSKTQPEYPWTPVATSKRGAVADIDADKARAYLDNL